MVLFPPFLSFTLRKLLLLLARYTPLFGPRLPFLPKSLLADAGARVHALLHLFPTWSAKRWNAPRPVQRFILLLCSYAFHRTTLYHIALLGVFQKRQRSSPAFIPPKQRNAPEIYIRLFKSPDA
ncbi:hypothetical protein N7G274_000222 [Stereocaulon virgatum]|uniref:Secreted protein n=1 Tax=Stereocaulon virgatum TaxID=373712 RepID=A0ABR4ARX9_9LECA